MVCSSARKQSPTAESVRSCWETVIFWLLKSGAFESLVPKSSQTPQASISSSIYFFHLCSLFLQNSRTLCSNEALNKPVFPRPLPFLIPSIITTLNIPAVLPLTESCHSSYTLSPWVVPVFRVHVLLNERQKTSAPTFAFSIINWARLLMLGQIFHQINQMNEWNVQRPDVFRIRWGVQFTQLFCLFCFPAWFFPVECRIY